MKIILLSIFLTSCGVAESMKPKCGSDIKMGCNALFGYVDEDQNKAIVDVENKNTEQDARLTLLEDQAISIIEAIDNLSNNSNGNSVMITALQNSTNAILIQMLSLSNSVVNINNEIESLNNNSAVTEVIDPCGDGVGFDEVILKTSDGELIAYFQHGNNRFLTKLSAGNYRTTDGTGCNFSVSSSGEVI